jgi:sigma-B regulation protein RsbQ
MMEQEIVNIQETDRVGAKTVVFLHYFGGAAASWKWVVDVLAADYRCITLNLPGFGGTKPLPEPSIQRMAKFVKEQLDKLKLEHVILVGHSMGGKIAVQVAIDDAASNLIAQLILVAPSPPSVERMPEEQQQSMRNIPDIDEAEKSATAATVIPLLGEEHDMAVDTQIMVEKVSREWWIDTGMKYSIAKGAKNLTLPITVIASKTDPAVTYEMTMKDTIPNLPEEASLISISDIGHLMPLENPEKLAQLIAGAIS